ncbi:Reverse transcriptase (RNA-dependent DNA polymerase) [Nesidiocoris tenuis]|nr:Reverse transcriptase (RNA-dependent DNA polymerase) [Nesidiocoris tenuis]
MDEVMQISLEEKADLLILQEPPVIQGKIPGIGLVNRCCAVSETPRSAVVVLNPTIDVLLLHEYSTDSLVVVKIRSARLEFTVVAAYFSPNERHEALLGRLDHAVAALSSQKMLLAGDFNAWCTLWGSASDNVRGREVAVWAAGRGFVLLNRPESGPTFRGNRGNSFIDLSWASSDLADVCLAWDLSFDTGSDHGVIRVLLTGGRRTTEDLPAVRFNTRKARWAPFRADAANIMIDYQLEEQQREDDDVGKAVAGLEQALVTAAANTLPLKGHKKGRQVPWWSQDLARLRREMRAARRRMQAADSPEDRRAMNLTYVRQRKQFKSAVRAAKRASWREFVESELTQDPWAMPYRVLRAKVGPDATIGALRLDGGRRASTWEEAGVRYLSTVFPSDDETLDSEEDSGMRRLVETALTTDPDVPWTMDELKRAVKSFSRFKAPGPDGIDMAMMKEAPEVFWEELLAIYNHALSKGVFPERWKLASIKALLKSGDRDPSDPGSYRPISLLSVLGKILERMILNRIEPRLVDAFHPNQFGCVKGKTTEDAITTLMSAAKRGTKKNVMIIFYDIAGAFNGVWWPLMLFRIRELSPPSNVYRLLVDYFRNRGAQLWFKQGKVDAAVTRGCPQGSVLGAALWNLLFADLLKVLESGGVTGVAYVDDLAVVVEADTQDGLVREAAACSRLVVDWCQRARLSVASNKTQALVVRGKKEVRETTMFPVGDARVRAGLCAKYLGVMFHRNGVLDQHLDMLRNKACSAVGLLKGVRGASWGLEFSRAARYYDTVFLPTVIYAAATWWNKPSKKAREKVQTIQRMALIPLTKAYRTAATAALQVVAGTPPLDLVLDARVAYCAIKWPERVLATVRPELAARTAAVEASKDKIAAIQDWVFEVWQERWQQGTTGRLTYEYLPNVRDRQSYSWLKPGYTETQLLVGHGNFNSKLHFFRRRDSPECPCGRHDETAEHVIRRCRTFRVVREQCFGTRTYDAGLNVMLSTKDAYEKFSIFAKRWHKIRGEGPGLAALA